jgi:hypothetical protein
MSKSRRIVIAILIAVVGLAAWFSYGPYMERRSAQRALERREQAVAYAMRWVNVAQVEFLNANNGRYSKSLQDLVEGDFIPAIYADVFSDYRLHYEPGNEGSTYELRAEPVLNKEEHKHFFSNENALLRYETGKQANLESPVFRD